MIAPTAEATSHAIAATAPTRSPPRRAASTVLAARSRRLGVDAPERSGSVAVPISQRYTAGAESHLGVAPGSAGPGAAAPGWPSRGNRHPFLLAFEARRGPLGGDLDVDRVAEVGLARRQPQRRVAERDRRGEAVPQRDLGVREDMDLVGVDQAHERQRAADDA